MNQSRTRLRLLLGFQLVWIVTACVLGAWWGYLVFKASSRIADLEKQLGAADATVKENLLKTHRMLTAESSVFIVLLLASSLFFFLMYWRDLRRSKAMNAFFAGVSHELRTPLTSIRLQAESLGDWFQKSKLNTDPKAQRLLDRLLEDTVKMESQVEKTLQLSRLEGGAHVQLQSVQINELIERAVEPFRNQSYQISLNLDDSVASCDPFALQVVIRNLFENSVRHSSLPKDQLKITIQVMASPAGIELNYRDNGVGIQDSHLRLGEIFEKGDHSQGAGVGLYLIKHLSERMNGKVEFMSEQGFIAKIILKKGTTS